MGLLYQVSRIGRADSEVDTEVLEELRASGAITGVIAPRTDVEGVVRSHREHHRVGVWAGLAERQPTTMASRKGGIQHALEEGIER